MHVLAVDTNEIQEPRVAESDSQAFSHTHPPERSRTRGPQVPQALHLNVPMPPLVPKRLAGKGDTAKKALRAAMGQGPVQNHPLVMTTSSRAIEKPLAEVAATHPQAAQAAHLTLQRVRKFVEIASPGLPAAKIFGSFTNEVDRTGHRFNQTGDIDPTQVDEAIKHGNLREHMCMLGNSQPIIARAMYNVGARAENDPTYVSTVQRDTGADVASIVARYQVFKSTGRPPEQFLHALEGTESVKQPHMRMSGVGPRKSGRFSDFQFTPPLSEREKAHLDAWRVIQEANGVAVMTRKDSDGNEIFLLPQEDGKTLFRPKADHTWHKQSNDHRMSTRVSISGTSYRLLHMNVLLGATPEHSEYFRTALLGHVTPYHHTYHEVMSASVEVGMVYVPGIESMRQHAQSILDSYSDETNVKTRDALIQKLSSVRRYEDAEG